ncbi:MAG: indole-3-glycerol phosphate synthase TrpC [bacterium]|nr:indole-3-glycerol phosphate synthase TrpC [bacterium]MDT8395078.1 indole-3-glycerol phosphate synthase TrpC [bacterium]
MKKGFLEKAAVAARQNVTAWKGRYGDLPVLPGRDRRPFLPTGQDGCAVIAEVKICSPSRGDLMGGSDPLRLAPMYTDAGASAVSVVVEEQYFGGSPELFEKVARSTALPLLWKDFVVDPYQIQLASSLGASAVLLIVGMLDDREMRSFLDMAARAGLRTLVEVHDLQEYERAAASGADLIGVNNRNLVTLEVDIAVSERMAPRFSEEVQTVAESGIRKPEDVARMAGAGFDAVLIGESLVTADDPAQLLQEMVAAGSLVDA